MRSRVIELLYEILDRSYEDVMKRSKRQRISNRNAALSIGVERVRNAKETRGLFSIRSVETGADEEAGTGIVHRSIE